MALATGIGFDHSGAASLAGAIGYIVFGAAFTSLIQAKAAFSITAPIQLFGSTGADQVFYIICGLIMGIISGNLYNKYYNIKLPEFLGFFGGRRFVPIVTSVVALFISAFVAMAIKAYL